MMLNPATPSVLTTPLLSQLYHYKFLFSTNFVLIILDTFVYLSQKVTFLI